MYRFCTAYLRVFLILLVLSGLLAPRMSAVLAEIVPGIQTMVICTGEGLVVWTIGPDGIPIEQPELVQHDCIMVDGGTGPSDILTFWQRLAKDYTSEFAVLENALAIYDHLMRLLPSRAPPVLV